MINNILINVTTHGSFTSKVDKQYHKIPMLNDMNEFISKYYKRYQSNFKEVNNIMVGYDGDGANAPSSYMTILVIYNLIYGGVEYEKIQVGISQRCDYMQHVNHGLCVSLNDLSEMYNFDKKMIDKINDILLNRCTYILFGSRKPIKGGDNFTPNKLAIKFTEYCKDVGKTCVTNFYVDVTLPSGKIGYGGYFGPNHAPIASTAAWEKWIGEQLIYGNIWNYNVLCYWDNEIKYPDGQGWKSETNISRSLAEHWENAPYSSLYQKSVV